MRSNRGGFFVLLVFGFVFFSASHVYAFEPQPVEQKSLADITEVSDPGKLVTYYGELSGIPNTYQIKAEQPFRLKLEIAVPDISASKNNISGIIIREVPGTGRVEEVARLNAKDAAWDTYYEPIGGDRYRQGPSFDEELPAGVYRIEVNTPDDVEKYVLTMGYREGEGLGYFEMVRRIAALKEFNGKSQLMVLQSPYGYIPFLVVIVILGVLVVRRERRLSAVV